MIATDHMMVGCVLTVSLANRRLPPAVQICAGVLAGFGSHFVLDALPHIDPGNSGYSYTSTGSIAFWLTALDCTVGLGTVAWFWKKIPRLRNSALLAVLAGSLFPDALMTAQVMGIANGAPWDGIQLMHTAVHQGWMIFLPVKTVVFLQLTLGATVTLWTFIYTFLYLLYLVPGYGKESQAELPALAVD